MRQFESTIYTTFKLHRILNQLLLSRVRILIVSRKEPFQFYIICTPLKSIIILQITLTEDSSCNPLCGVYILNGVQKNSTIHTCCEVPKDAYYQYILHLSIKQKPFRIKKQVCVAEILSFPRTSLLTEQISEQFQGSWICVIFYAQSLRGVVLFSWFVHLQRLVTPRLNSSKPFDIEVFWRKPFQLQPIFALSYVASSSQENSHLGSNF